MVVSTCQLHLYQEIYHSSQQLPFFRWCWSECDWHTGFSRWQPIVCWQSEADCVESNRSRMCEIRLTKLSCAAQRVGIVHFYAVTEIKGLSCRLWWMHEWRNLLTSTHVGYRSVIRAITSGASLKFGVQGASATNWFSWVNGARDKGIRLYKELNSKDTLQMRAPRVKSYRTNKLVINTHAHRHIYTIDANQKDEWKEYHNCPQVIDSHWGQYFLLTFNSVKGSELETKG